MFTLQVISSLGAESSEADQNLITDAPQVSTLVQGAGSSQAGRDLAQVSTPVPTNVFMRTLQGNLGFSASQVWVRVEDGYDTQDTVTIL